MQTQVYLWRSGDAPWWLIARYYADSGYASPYQFLTALRTANPVVYQLKGAWDALTPGTAIMIPSRA